MSLRSPFVDDFEFSFASIVDAFSRKISLRTLSRLSLLPLTSSAKREVSVLRDFLGMTFARIEGDGERAGGEGLR